MIRNATRAVDFGDVVLIFEMEATAQGTGDLSKAVASRTLRIKTPRRTPDGFGDPVTVPQDQAAATVEQWIEAFKSWTAAAGEYNAFTRDLDPCGGDLTRVGSIGNAW